MGKTATIGRAGSVKLRGYGGAALVVILACIISGGCTDSGVTEESLGLQALLAGVDADGELGPGEDDTRHKPLPIHGRDLAELDVGGELNQVWFEATPGAEGGVISQGAGQVLELECVSFGAAVQCEWTVEMLLSSIAPLSSWDQGLFTKGGLYSGLEVIGFQYDLTQFTTPNGGESFGLPPDLLVGTGASAPQPEGVPAGDYPLVELTLRMDFDGVDTTQRSISTRMGELGWTDSNGDPPAIQFGDNAPIEASPGGVPANAVIVINAVRAVEICDDDIDNDRDDLIDCEDPDCADSPSCAAPVLTCPADLTVECDGAGNSADLDAWLTSESVENVCENLTVTNDFVELSDECAATGSALVTWTATDECGTDTCMATITVEDTTPPEIGGIEDLVVECDESGNGAALEAWLAGASAEDACGQASLSDDFDALSDECATTGSATVTWTATDECQNSASASATFTIEDTNPPAISGVQDQLVECDGAGNVADLEAWLETNVTAEDTCGQATIATDVGDLSDGCGETGSADANWEATDECGNSASTTATFTIEDTTTPEVTLNGEAEITLECGHMFDDPGATAADLCDLELTEANVGGDEVDVNTPGMYVVTYGGVDACGNEAEPVSRTVEIVDMAPPEVVVADLVELWPPNHKYRSLSLSDCVVSVLDGCEGELDVDEIGTILSIYSDEPVDVRGTGDGHSINDIVIAGDSAFRVRVERQGGGNGRVYGVRFEVSDSAGNTSEHLCFFGVPHDQSGDPPIDDGPESGYTVP